MAKLNAEVQLIGGFIATKSRVNSFNTILSRGDQHVEAINADVSLFKDDESYELNEIAGSKGFVITDLSGWDNPMTDEQTLSWVEGKLPYELNTANANEIENILEGEE